MKNINATYKGLIAGILMIGLSVLFFYGLKYPVTGNNQVVILLVYVVAIIWSLFSLKKRSQPIQLKFKDYFSEGFKTYLYFL
jgi:predicted lipid-binding transport protein (Tim44 family)